MCAVVFGPGDKNEHTGGREVYLPLTDRGPTAGVAVRGAMVETSSEGLATAVLPFDRVGTRHRGIAALAGSHIGPKSGVQSSQSSAFGLQGHPVINDSSTHDSRARRGYVVDSRDWPDIGNVRKSSYFQL